MNKEQRIEEIMNSLDGIQRAEANYFLYQKISNRIHIMEQTTLSPQMSWRLAVALATVILLNVLTFRHLKQEAVAERNASVINSEYSISLPDSY